MGFWRDSLGINWPNIVGILSALGFVLAVAGGFLGWWTDFGELLGIATGILAVLSFFTSASRQQVEAIRTGVGGRMDRGFESVRDELRGNHREQTGILRDIRDALRRDPRR